MGTGRKAGSKFLTPEQIEEIRLKAIEEGKSAIKQEFTKKMEDTYNQLRKRIESKDRKEEQRESIIAILRDATKTNDLIVNQAVIMLQEIDK